MILMLQPIHAAFTLAFGTLGLLAWWRMETERWTKPGAAWLVTGGCFTVMGLVGGALSLAAVAAVRAGPGSGLYTMFVEWNPVGNIGRTAGVVAYAVVLAALVAAPAPQARNIAKAGLGLVAASMLCGTAAAALHRGMTNHSHMTTLAVLDTICVVALLVALLLGVMNDGLDLLLWLAVAAYTLKQTVGVSLMAILAWWERDQTVQAGRILLVLSVAVMAGTAVLAYVRLRRAMERRYVPALFERLHAMRRPAES